jgi:hypothetical protein
VEKVQKGRAKDRLIKKEAVVTKGFPAIVFEDAAVPESKGCCHKLDNLTSSAPKINFKSIPGCGCVPATCLHVSVEKDSPGIKAPSPCLLRSLGSLSSFTLQYGRAPEICQPAALQPHAAPGRQSPAPMNWLGPSHPGTAANTAGLRDIWSRETSVSSSVC